MVWPDSFEDDRTSADFGKIKIGDTRFDISGGMGGLVVLAFRLWSVDIDNKWEVFSRFVENKFSPAASLAKALAEKKFFGGEEITTEQILTSLFVPLPIENFMDTAEADNAANIIAILIAEGLGISTQTYADYNSYSY